MREFKQIGIAYPDAASGTSLTSALEIPTEFDEYAILVPALAVNTAVCCGVRVLVSDTSTGTYYDVTYSSNPATATSAFTPWQSPGTAPSGAMVMCEALRFCPGYAKFQYLTTATANTGAAIRVFGRMG